MKRAVNGNFWTDINKNSPVSILSIFLMLIATCFFCCSSDNGDGDNGNGISVDLEILASNIMSDYNIHDGLDFCPDGKGGIYFMETRNTGNQRILHWTETGVEDIGLRPTGFINSVYNPSFLDLHCDSAGGIYLLIEYLAEHFRHIIYRVDVEAEWATPVADTTTLLGLYNGAGLNPNDILSIYSRIAVTPGGEVWLFAIDPDNHSTISRLSEPEKGGTPCRLAEKSFDYYGVYRLGLAFDGDLLLTEVTSYADSIAGMVWRVDPTDGLQAFMSIEGFPHTISAFCELENSALVFATNYLLNIDDNLVLAPTGTGYYVVDVNVDWSTEGTDWLFYLSGTAGSWNVYKWNSGELVAELGRELSPEFWYFWWDPYDGSIITFDQVWGNGDLYRITFE